MVAISPATACPAADAAAVAAASNDADAASVVDVFAAGARLFLLVLRRHFHFYLNSCSFCRRCSCRLWWFYFC